MTVTKLRACRKVPLRIGDVWIYIGPATEVRIVALSPRPTEQKANSQAVTLDDGRTIAEATLRFGFQRKREYLAYRPILERKLRRETATIYAFPKP